MQYYPHIDTCFKRSQEKGPNHNKIIYGDWTRPEFEALKDLKWEATEKIDGTNMSYQIVTKDGKTDISIAGKTPAANIPGHLLKAMQEKLTPEKIVEVFGKTNPETSATEMHYLIEIFGEGYGVKIQKGGNYLKDRADFILFDVKITPTENGKPIWLTRSACEDIAQKLGIEIVPLIGYFTLDEAVEFVKKGFKSVIAQNPDYDAEGLVLRAPCGLLTRMGERIITKIKHCDFY
jgi:hypothetical protein